MEFRTRYERRAEARFLANYRPIGIAAVAAAALMVNHPEPAYV
jgi:hypothetical protein